MPKTKRPTIKTSKIKAVKPVSKEERIQLLEDAKTDFKKVAQHILKANKAPLKPSALQAIAGETLDWIRQDGLDNIFVYEHIIKKYDLSYQSIHAYRLRHPDFDFLIKQALELQEYKLARLMLRNKINTQAAIFTLKNRHGWTEKSQVEVRQDVVDAVQQARRRLETVNKNDEVDDDLIIDVEYTLEEDDKEAS